MVFGIYSLNSFCMLFGIQMFNLFYGLWWLKALVLMTIAILMVPIMGIPLIVSIVGLIVLGNYASKYVDRVIVDQKATETYKLDGNNMSSPNLYDPYSRLSSDYDWNETAKYLVKCLYNSNNMHSYYVRQLAEKDDDIKVILEHIHTKNKQIISNVVAEDGLREVERHMIKVPSVLLEMPYPVAQMIRMAVLYGFNRENGMHSFKTIERSEQSILDFLHGMHNPSSAVTPGITGLKRKEWITRLCINPRVDIKKAKEVMDAFTELVYQYVLLLDDSFATTMNNRIMSFVQTEPGNREPIKVTLTSLWDGSFNSGLRKKYLAECKIYVSRSDKRKQLDELRRKMSTAVAKFLDATIGRAFRFVWKYLELLW